MTAKLFYFTGTGNTFHAAHTIAALIDAAHTERILSSSEARHCSDDAIGIVFPVYLHLPPKAVMDFVNNLALKKGSYLFTVVTHNGEPGDSHRAIDRILRKKGTRLDAAFNILMPGNSVIIADYTQDVNERTRRLDSVNTACGNIADAVMRREKNNITGDSPISFLKSAIMRRFMKTYRLPAKFNVDPALCSGCATCARVCPERNIAIDMIPSWGNTCGNCLACYHLCPVQAINIESYTKERLRYRHPKVKISDLFVQGEQ